jgi:hypothetical protein
MSELFTGQELYCFLQDYVLTNPLTDNWGSVKEVIRTWCDGILGPGKVEFFYTTYALTVWRDGECVVKLKYAPAFEYPLYLATSVDGLEDGGWFRFTFQEGE